jgi:thiamine-monophosphate kinase
MILSNLGEKKLIERLRRQLAQVGSRAGLVVDIGDDTAAFRVAGAEKLTLFTCDMLVEGTHFRRAWFNRSEPDSNSLQKLGWKALAVNISDIAAMGGRPTFALISIALPGDIEAEYVDKIYSGLLNCAQEYGVIIAGGDTVGSPQGIVMDISLLGEVEEKKILRRSGARVGDLIAVTGPLGGAGGGLELLEKGLIIRQNDSEARKENWGRASVKPAGGVREPRPQQPEHAPESSIGKASALDVESLMAALLEPRPRLAEGQALAATGRVTAMMDLSDGLADDLPRLCQESKTGAIIQLEKLPVNPACEKAGLEALKLALQGGEDYELLFTFAPQNLAAITAALHSAGAPPPQIIGEMTSANEGIRLINPDGTTAERPEGFKHFGN